MSERLSPGDTAPDFTLPDDKGGKVSLSDLRGKKVIVYFYPAAMTPGCTKQACDFTDSLASLQAQGYDVLGISQAPKMLSTISSAIVHQAPITCPTWMIT